MTAFVRSSVRSFVRSFVRFRSFDFVRSISFVRFRSFDFVRSISFVRFRSFDFVRCGNYGNVLLPQFTRHSLVIFRPRRFYPCTT